MEIYNNTALVVSNQLKRTSSAQTKSLAKLSSGLRINQAADDASGLSISEKMKAQIRGLEQAQRNIQDGISLLQTADSGLSEIGDPSLIRLRELSVMAANDTLNSDDRLHIQEEIGQLLQSINDIANNTTFNNINLLNQVVKERSVEESIIKQGMAAKVTAPVWVSSGFKIFTGVNDTFEFRINGEDYEFQIASGTYSDIQFLNELNSKLESNDVPLTATFSPNTTKLVFTSPVGDYRIEDITSKSTEGYFIVLCVASRSPGIIAPGLPILNPGVTIDAGVNDTLTFNVDSNFYSITMSPGDYTVYGASQSHLNENSPLLEEINKRLIEVGAPVKAQLIYYANDDPPFNNGAGLLLTALENSDASSYLLDGDHTFGNFGGNAKSTLMEQVLDGWDISDSSAMNQGNVITMPAEVYGEADLSDGLVIETGKNDTLNFDINGVPKTIVLSNGSYNATELISEINNQFANNALELTAKLNILNKLVISQTNPFGGDRINNLSGNGLLELFFELNQGEAPIVQKATIPAQGTLSIQVGPNGEEGFLLNLADVRTTALGIDDINVTTRNSAESAITLIDHAIQKVNSERGKFGAYQNRLEYAHKNVNISSENMISSESRIRDADMAREIMNHSKHSILSQAAQAMLAQANQLPEGVLQLLR